MTTLDHAIENLSKLLMVFSHDGNTTDAMRTSVELLGFEDVRDGVPRGRREQGLHHPDLVYRYRQARMDAELLAGVRDEREIRP